MAAAEKAERDAERDARKTLKCVERVMSQRGAVYDEHRVPVDGFYVFYPPTSPLMPGERTIRMADERVQQIALDVSREYNAPLDCDRDASYPAGDAPERSGYLSGAVLEFAELTSADRRRKVAAHFVENVDLTVPVLEVSSTRVEHNRFVRVTVLSCVSQGDLDSIVTKLRAWHAENVQLAVNRCPHPPVPLMPEVWLTPRATGMLLGKGGRRIRDLLDAYDAVKHFYVLENPHSLELGQFMAVSAEFKAVLDTEVQGDGGFVDQLLERVSRVIT